MKKSLYRSINSKFSVFEFRVPNFVNNMLSKIKPFN